MQGQAESSLPSPCSCPARQLCGGGKDARNTHTPAAVRPALSCALPLSLPSLSVTQARYLIHPWCMCCPASLHERFFEHTSYYLNTVTPPAITCSLRVALTVKI